VAAAESPLPSTPTSTRPAGIAQDPSVPQRGGNGGMLPRKLLPSLETGFYDILREWLDHAIRHGGSDRLQVEVSKERGTLRLEIRDWAADCGPDALQRISQRAESLGGRVSIKTGAAGDTLLAIELSLR
jgi:signal transduction histidine kinase